MRVFIYYLVCLWQRMRPNWEEYFYWSKVSADCDDCYNELEQAYRSEASFQDRQFFTQPQRRELERLKREGMYAWKCALAAMEPLRKEEL